MTHSRRRGYLTEAVIGVAERIPVGVWTTYGDIGAMLGNRRLAQAVGTVVRNGYVPNAHRILPADGRIAEGFTPHDVADVDRRARLITDGVTFVGDRANPAQRWDIRLAMAGAA